MAFFKKLFEKKECNFCGGEIGLLGNRKLEDGNMCKECARKLSPWFDERRHSTVEQIKAQLAYREENKQKLASFHPVKSYGENYELKVELANGVPSRFVVAQTSNYLEENADLIAFKDVTSFNIDIDEHERELKQRNSEGEMVSYKPPRYEYSYEFRAEIFTNHPYCDDIRFRLNRNTLNLETIRRQGHPGLGQNRGAANPFLMGKRDFDPTLYPEYREYKALCDELEALFKAGMEGTALPGHAPVQTVQIVQETAPVQAAAKPKFCPNCGAPYEGGKFCQSCGSRL
jgi:uncharacterized protein (DUF1499 family)